MSNLQNESGYSNNHDIYQMIYILRLSVEENTKMFRNTSDKDLKVSLALQRKHDLETLEGLYKLLPEDYF